MILFLVCICICADMDMTEWERCTFRGYILPPRMPESLCHPCITLMALVNLSCIILYSADLKPNIFSGMIIFFFSFFFIFLYHWWGLSCWKVFMRYLRCHIFNIEMPSCLVLLKRRRKYAKLIFSNFFAFDRYRKYKALQKVFYSTKHKVNSKTKCCIKT